mgnify:CR=1 FL=1
MAKDHGSSIKDEETYEELRKQGESKEKAARIANAQANSDQKPSEKGGQAPPYEEWHKDEAERVRKEDEKARKLVLQTWRKMLMGLRIVERVNEEFGAADANADVLNPWISKKKKNAAEDIEAEAQKRIMDQNDEDMAGGFLPEGFDAEEPDDHHHHLIHQFHQLLLMVLEFFYGL